MCKNFFVLFCLCAASFGAYAERKYSVSSANVVVPVSWQLGKDSMTVGTGITWNKIILPDVKSFIGLDYGLSLSVPVARFMGGQREFVHKNYLPALNLQGIFGILFTPYISPKYYFGIGGAFAMTAVYTRPVGGVFSDSDFSVDFGVGAEMRLGMFVTERFAITAGFTLLFDFYRLDFVARQYSPQKNLSVFPCIGFGIKGK